MTLCGAWPQNDAIIVTGKRRQNAKTKNCAAPSKIAAGVEALAGLGAEYFGDIATGTAVIGQEELAGPAEGAAVIFSLIKAGSQAYRGNTSGAFVTVGSTALGKATTLGLRFIPTGVKNASTNGLRQLFGKGVEVGAEKLGNGMTCGE